MKNENEYRITIFLNEEEYRKLKYIAEYLKKYNKERKSIPNLSAKLLFILIEALDDKKTETRTALLSILDKENKEKSIKAVLENIQNDQDGYIDSPKLIENLAFLSNVKKAIKKMEEDDIENNIKTTKENRKTESKTKENENQKDTEKGIKENKTIKEENEATEEKYQKETQLQKEEKIKTEIEIKEKKEDDDKEEIIRFPDL